MSLNIPNTPTQPCISPYTFNLHDCLACSSCISDTTLESYTKLTYLTKPSIILITPHVKLNLYSMLNIQIEYTTFENVLMSFMEMKKCVIVDVSNYYTLLYHINNEKEYLNNNEVEELSINQKIYDFNKIQNNQKLEISSNCPAIVNYLRGRNKHVKNLRTVMSVQQICNLIYANDKRRKISVCGCLDKKSEGNIVMLVMEFYQYLIENGFLDYMNEMKNMSETELNDRNLEVKNELKNLPNDNSNNEINVDSNQNSCNKKQTNYKNDACNTRNIDVNTNDIFSDFIHKTAEFDKNYMSSLLTASYKINKINNNFIEYIDNNTKFARINGLVNLVNYLNRAESYDYKFVEAYMCKEGCINGPGMFKVDIEKEISVMNNFKKVEVNVIGFKESIDRTFEAQRNIKKTFKVEW